MLNGPRGCGKSMIFRYMLADCQRLVHGCELRDLPFLAFLVSIKNTGPTPSLTEFRRLENRHANLVLNEHVLTIFVAAKVFSALSRLSLPTDAASAMEAAKYSREHFEKRMTTCGGTSSAPEPGADASAVFSRMAETCDDSYNTVVQYAKRFGQSEYTGALCGYMDFLLPLLLALKELSFLPSAAIYLLVDDADYLNWPQTMALNSWISTRTQGEVSIKISSQLRYKTRGDDFAVADTVTSRFSGDQHFGYLHYAPRPVLQESRADCLEATANGGYHENAARILSRRQGAGASYSEDWRRYPSAMAKEWSRPSSRGRYVAIRPAGVYSCTWRAVKVA